MFLAGPCHLENAIRFHDEGVKENSTCGFISGRIEICNDEVWKAICDSDWTRTDAAVACRQLGYSAIGEHPFVYILSILKVNHSLVFYRGKCVAGIPKCSGTCTYSTRM